MEKAELTKLKRRLRYLEKKITDIGPVMRGSVVIIGTKNKQPYFSMNKDKKTQLLYLGKHRENTVRRYVDNYRKLLELIDEITLIYIQLVKADAISFKNDASHNQT